MENINISNPNDGLGDKVRDAFNKVNLNFTELDNGKEVKLLASDSTKYYRGDKSWQTLDKTAVGLNLVDNTADSNKPVSIPQQNALNAKEPAITSGTTSQYWRGDKTWQSFPAQATVDQTIIDGSTNAVSSNAVFDALATKAPISSVHNPVTLGTANGLSLATQQLSLGLASSGVTGALSGTDWNIFNGKFNTPTGLTTNYLPKWNGSGFGNSQIFDNGGTDISIINGVYSEFSIKGNQSLENGGGQLNFSNQTKRFATISGETESPNNGLFIVRNLRAGELIESLRIIGNGNIGINKSSPSAKLHIVGGSGYADNIASNSNATLKLALADPNQIVFFGLNSNNGGASFIQSYRDSDSAPQRFIINPYGGNVGIGTTNPTANLTVKGAYSVGSSIPADWALLSAGRMGVAKNNKSLYFDIFNGYAEVSTYDWSLWQAYPIVFQANGGNSMFGTNVDNGVDKLQVNGTISASSYTATSLPVFENNASASSLAVGQFYRTSTGVLMVKF